MIRIGVAGLGAAARFYLAAIERSPVCSLGAVCDRDPAALTDRLVPVYWDHRAMLADGGLDAVVVTTSDGTHAAVCRDVLDAGLPVCVEQPLATTLPDGQDLVERAEKQDVALFTAFHRRYNNSVLALRDQLATAGPIRSLTVRCLASAGEHDGDGCVATHGPNAFDLVRMFLGPVPMLDAWIVSDESGVDCRAVLAFDGATVRLDSSHRGEVKDVEALLADGRVLRADMLAGHREHDDSLWHEYDGVLREFAAAVRVGGAWTDGGFAALSLVGEAYRRAGVTRARTSEGR